MPGLVRYDEVAAGAIAHALRFTTNQTRKAYLYPARHSPARRPPASLPPMGLRVRLQATYDTSGFLPQARVIAEALKRYGMILADNGSPWYISGMSDPVSMTMCCTSSMHHRPRPGGRRHERACRRPVDTTARPPVVPSADRDDRPAPATYRPAPPRPRRRGHLRGLRRAGLPHRRQTSVEPGSTGSSWTSSTARSPSDLLPGIYAVQATPAAALVRVEEGTRLRIGRALDFGAEG